MNPPTLHPAYRLRPAAPPDTAAIVGLIRELAEFEQLAHLMQATPERLEAHLFGPRPLAEAVVVTHTPHQPEPAVLEGAEKVVAFALFFHNYSTFLARPGLYLEDLYVQPDHRGAGLGKALLHHLAQLAVARDCGRFEWSVLDWNANAIQFYQRMGATVLPDWRICRVTGDALRVLAATERLDPPPPSGL